MELSIFAMFMAASLWYLLPMAVAIIILFFFIAIDEGLPSFYAMVAFTGLALFGVDNLWETVIASPIKLITTSIVFVLIGFFWSLFRWYKYLVTAKRAGKTRAPKVSEYKDNIAFWIFTWPIDVLVYIFGDLVSDFFRLIWKYTQNIYQTMSDNVYKNISAD